MMTPKIGDQPPHCLGEKLKCSSYRQVYVIKRHEEGALHTRDVSFQCGSWCYEGKISLDFLDKGRMSISDIPAVAPSLQKQQEELSYVSNSSK